MKIQVTITPEESGFSASSDDLPHVLLLAEGETIEEVKQDMLEAIAEVSRMDDAPAPLREGYEVEWSFSDHS